MDLKINDQLFVVTGASSGLGNAVAITLLKEGAGVIVVSRRESPLNEMSTAYPGKVDIVIGDVQDEGTLEGIMKVIDGRSLSGIFVNAGGPPAMSFEETSLEEWDKAYRLLIRWKVDLVRRLLPGFRKQAYGRILFSESSTVKQPIDNLVLSNAMRMAIAGAAKTLSQEVASSGITVNIIAPGFHETAAIDRLFKKKSEMEGISAEEARQGMLDKIPTGTIGSVHDFASLAAWLLSPLSSFVTGQVYTLDGGTTKSSIG